MSNKDNIISTLKSMKPELAAKYHIDSLALFGSVARGEAREDSDIDILFEVANGAKLSIFAYLKLAGELEAKLHSKVDLVRESKLKDGLKPYVLRDALYV
jgi:uncharacterized protein